MPGDKYEPLDRAKDWMDGPLRLEEYDGFVRKMQLLGIPGTHAKQSRQSDNCRSQNLTQLECVPQDSI